MVSQSGGTEIVLRNGLATVLPSPINLQNRNQTFLPNDTLELQEENTFLRLTTGKNSKVQPQKFKNKLNDFYDQEIKVEPITSIGEFSQGEILVGCTDGLHCFKGVEEN